MKGMDVSRYQGKVDWAAAKADGIQFALLRAGYGRLPSQKDAYFEQNYAACMQQGIPVGCYWYSYATDEAAVAAEAEACLQAIAGKTFALGVWFDQEYERKILALSNAKRTRLIWIFLEKLRAAGYCCGLYCSEDWIKTKVDAAALAGVDLWLARYGTHPAVRPGLCLWQYSSTGRVAGVVGNVDLDELFALPQAAGPLAGLGTALLRRGSRGMAVVRLQTILAQLGYAPGKADGIFGAKTEAAVRAFQKTEGLAADGIVGKNTHAALAARQGR